MSYSLDVNILVYATDQASRFHVNAKAFMAQCFASDEPLCLAWSTLLGYQRIATHPRIFAKPLCPAAALSNITQLTALPQTHLLTEREGFLGLYAEVTSQLTVRGNLVPDAHLATLLKQHGVGKLYTHDKDFRKFEFLTLGDPLSS